MSPKKYFVLTMAAGVVDLGGVGGPGRGLHHPLRCVPLPQDQEAGQAAHGVEQVNCSCTITITPRHPIPGVAKQLANFGSI